MTFRVIVVSYVCGSVPKNTCLQSPIIRLSERVRGPQVNLEWSMGKRSIKWKRSSSMHTQTDANTISVKQTNKQANLASLSVKVTGSSPNRTWLVGVWRQFQHK